MNPSTACAKRAKKIRLKHPCDLRIVDATKTPRTNGGFRRTITACEVVADLPHHRIVHRIGTKRIGISASAGTSIMEPYCSGRSHLVLPLSWFLMLTEQGPIREAIAYCGFGKRNRFCGCQRRHFFVALAISFSSGFLFSRWLLVLCFTIVPLALFAEKTCMYLLVSACMPEDLGTRECDYGAGNTGRRVFSTLRRSPRLGFEPVLFVDDDPRRLVLQFLRWAMSVADLHR